MRKYGSTSSNDQPALPNWRHRSKSCFWPRVHELATNAVKHGALSIPAGRVDVGWQVEQADGLRTLRLEWIESGGPPVTPPAHRGFGMTLIERSLPHDLNGAVTIDFNPGGVHASLRATLPEPRRALTSIGKESRARAPQGVTA